MSMTDPIADMLTRIRNANHRMKGKVDVPASKIKEGMLKILKEEGFIANYKFISDRKQGILRIYMKYTSAQDRVITNLRSISKPGCRVYCSVSRLPKVNGGLGIAIVSTPRGLMSDRKCREAKLGGEVLCYVW